MFKEKVNARTDGRTTDNGLWHKLAGLRPVELTKPADGSVFEQKTFESIVGGSNSPFPTMNVFILVKFFFW